MKTFDGQTELVTTIITTYKRSDTLKRAIDSVLSQTYKNIEVIVVDDNDKDNYQFKTENLMDSYLYNERITYIQHGKNMNGANARNTGIKYAKGDYITFLDDDDFFDEKRFEILIPYLSDTDENTGIICSGFIYLKEGKQYKSQNVRIPGNLTNQLLKTEFDIGSGSNFIVKKKVIDFVIGFDTQFERHQDLEFLLRVSEYFKFMSCDEKLLFIELDETHQNKLNIDRLIETKKKYITKFNYLFNEEEKKGVLKPHYENVIYQIFLNNQTIKYMGFTLTYIRQNNYCELPKIFYLFIKAKMKRLLSN